MTTFAAAETALLAELKDRIDALTPQSEPSKRFKTRLDSDKSLREMAKSFGIPRLFDILPGRRVGAAAMGNAHAFPIYEYDVQVIYPTQTQHWVTSALSDAEIIKHAFLSNNVTVSGVQQRWCRNDSSVIIEADPSDPWMTLTLTITVYYDVTF